MRTSVRSKCSCMGEHVTAYVCGSMRQTVRIYARVCGCMRMCINLYSHASVHMRART